MHSLSYCKLKCCIYPKPIVLGINQQNCPLKHKPMNALHYVSGVQQFPCIGGLFHVVHNAQKKFLIEGHIVFVLARQYYYDI